MRTVRRTSESRLARTVAVAAGGAFTAWLVQTSVDWMALIPGLTGIALAGATALYRPWGSSRMPDGRRARLALVAVATAAAILGAVTIFPRIPSLADQSSAQAALARDQPAAAVRDATRAIEYDPHSVTALVLRAAAFARLHSFAPALADLQNAISLEPQNWATWALLGDLLARRGELAGARAAYRHAIALNPREPELQSSLEAVSRPSGGRR